MADITGLAKGLRHGLHAMGATPGPDHGNQAAVGNLLRQLRGWILMRIKAGSYVLWYKKIVGAYPSARKGQKIYSLSLPGLGGVPSTMVVLSLGTPPRLEA